MILESVWKLYSGGHLTRFSALLVLTYFRTLRSSSRKTRQLTHQSEFPNRLLLARFTPTGYSVAAMATYWPA
jgi:hypothetical protein